MEPPLLLHPPVEGASAVRSAEMTPVFAFPLELSPPFFRLVFAVAWSTSGSSS
jgi:hypothetical protein